MGLRIGDTAPDFEADSTQGRLRFHDWVGDCWAVLFSHPKDFTPVCTTELGYMAKIKPEFDRRNVKIIELSADPITDHERWAADIEETRLPVRDRHETELRIGVTAVLQVDQQPPARADIRAPVGQRVRHPRSACPVSFRRDSGDRAPAPQLATR